MKKSSSQLFSLALAIGLCTIQTVPLFGSVILIDDDGWWVDQDSPEYQRFLSGDLSEIPFHAPAGMGSAQINTLHTHTQAMRSFASIVGSQSSLNKTEGTHHQIWATGIGHYFTQENQNFSPGYHYRALGSALGYNLQLDSEWTTGLAFGELNARQISKGSAVGGLNQQQLMGLLYVGKDFTLDSSNTVNLTLQGGYGNSTNQGTIHFTEMTVQPDFYGFWRDESWFVDLTARWTHRFTEKLSLVSYAGLQYITAKQNDHSIRNGIYDFRFTGGSAYNLTASVGTGVVYQDTMIQIPYTASLSLGIAQDIDRESPSVLIRGKTHTWKALGSKPGHTAFVCQSSIQFKLTSAWELGLQHNLEYAENRLDQTGALSLSYTF